ncbi:MAG: hypothetical protein ACMUIA_04055 [bacterium]
MIKKKKLAIRKVVFVCIFCFLGIWAIPETVQAGPGDAAHDTHLNVTRGPQLGSNCATCHTDKPPSEANADYSRCIPCHSPDGAYDGMNDPDIGAVSNWGAGAFSAIYEADGSLREGKEKWCIGCHDDGRCVIKGVTAPNIAGLSLSGDWQVPGTLVSSDILGVENLLDNNPATGITGNGSYLIVDLGDSVNLSHLRLYNMYGAANHWAVYGGNDLANWTRIVLGQSVIFAAPSWQTGPPDGWNEIRLDRFIPVRYLKMAKVSPWPLLANTLCELELKKDIQYGYYANGHKITCSCCHDTTGVHTDADSQTYKASLDNYQSGYRLRSVQVGEDLVPPLEIPRIGCNWGEFPRTSNDFALCFACHDKYKLLGDAYGTDDFFQYPLQTNFRNDDHRDINGNVLNEHLRHLRGRYPCGNGQDWDSDWEGSRYPIADNTQATTTGTWTVLADDSSAYGANYLLAEGVSGDPDATCRWESQLPFGAIYNVYARWVAGPGQATDAAYRIRYYGGTSTATVSVDQTQSGGEWNLLGTYTFSGGLNESVELTNQANGQVCADAIKFEQQATVTADPNRYPNADNKYATVTGDWISSTAILGYYGVDYLQAPGVPDTATATCRWEPDLPYGGIFRVYARWTASTDRTTDARYTVSFQGGSALDTVSVNQTLSNGLWVLLGTYEFRDTGNEYVELTNVTADPNVYVIADAIRLVLFPPDSFYDSPMSCTACHNVHGSPAPAMTRHGELTSTPGTADKAPMINFHYLDANSDPDPEILTASESIGGKTQFYGPGPGIVEKNFTCKMCHPDQMIYHRSPVPSPITDCRICHAEGIESSASHGTHLAADLKGPSLDCGDCHAPGDAINPHGLEQLFADGRSLAETEVCDNCHSPGGAYDGVNDPLVGAKNNWKSGVYEGSALQSGKGKWCVTCHDSVPANSEIDGSGISAPNIAGDDDTYGFYANGHKNYPCSACHDLTRKHIDGESRTYAFDSAYYGASQSGIAYASGYRLRYVNGQVPLMIPANYNITFSYNAQTMRNNAFRLCFDCHDDTRIFDNTPGDGLDTNFKASVPNPPRNYSYAWGSGADINEHVSHILNYTGPYADSDWDTDTTGPGGQNGRDTLMACSSCHNVHGAAGMYSSTNEPMIRDGSLAGRTGYGFSYVVEDVAGGGYPMVTSTGATQAGSVGAVFRNNTANMCGGSMCHGNPAPPPGSSYNASGSAWGTYLEYYRPPLP